jgi:ribosomal protein S18 acetylase RimI-like enzyme
MIPHAIWITDLIVGRPLRKRGIARQLIAAAELWAKQRNLRRVMVEVQSKNAPAVRIVQKLGFEFCGYNDQYYVTRDVALFFSRSL